MKIALTGGAYTARSVIISAQRSLNLYAEPIPEVQGEPSKWAYLPTPGLSALGTLPQNCIRGIRQVATGAIYAVAGNGVYRVDPVSWTGTWLGAITGGLTTPVSMSDNGSTLVIVDGTSGGWTVDLASDAINPISDPAFYGATRVEFLDTFFVFNKPATPQFYWSDSLATTFSPENFINKEGYSDLLQTLAVAKLEIWLLGARTTEIYYDAGQQSIADVQFQRQGGVFVDWGCLAPYSAAVYDDAVYWLGCNRAGQGVVLAGQNYQTRRISTFALEAHFAEKEFTWLTDAIGFVYSLGGHAYYVLTFPTLDETWVYDITTAQWHEWKWLDSNGVEHRHRANCAAYVGDWIVVGDWQNGNLYRVDPNVYTDDGAPIKRQRSFPHLINEMDRVFYRQFVADIESGNPAGDPAGTTETLLSCSFTAPDGTLLQSYTNSADTNAIWTLGGGPGAEVEGNRLTFLAGGETAYSSVPMTAADYTLSFDVIPTSYSSVTTPSVVVVARANGSGGGYAVTIGGDGTQYNILLAVLGGGASIGLNMGTIPSGFYTATMSLQGTLITVTVQRSSDGLYLGAGGIWAAAAVPALTLTDSTYTAPGFVLIGGATA